MAFVIDANKVLRYKGAIDNDPRGEARKRGAEVHLLLEKAIEAALKGEKPLDDWTMASGRPIRRVPKGGGEKGR